MVTWFYFIVFAASFLMTSRFMVRNKRVDTLYMLFGITVTINSMGRWLIAASSELGQAIWANKLTYIGACYAPIALSLVLAKLCGFRIPRTITHSLSFLAAVVIGFVMTIGHSDIYYKSVELAHGDGYNYLVKEYGPAHVLYLVLMGMSIILLLYIIAYALKNRTKIPSGTVIAMSVITVAVQATYVITRLLDTPIEWLSIGYLAAIGVFNRKFEQINMYDLSANIASAIEQMRDYGAIVFDKNGNYINSNDLIRNSFPSINEWETEKPPRFNDDPSCAEIQKAYERLKTGEKRRQTIRIGEQYFDVSLKAIMFKKKRVGDMLEMLNKTVEHKYTAQVVEFNSRLKDEVDMQTSHINAIKDKMVIGMAAMVESRDNSTGGHIQRTSEVIRLFSAKLAEHSEELGIDEEFIDMIIRAAPMHDLGKIAVDDRILRKQGAFTPEEYNEMKKHSAEGAKTVRHILHGIESERFVEVAENVAHYHHEKWNGTGYPCVWRRKRYR